VASNARAGANAKARSKKYLLKQHAVFDMEMTRAIFKPAQGFIFTKQDQAGADLLYLDLVRDAAVFVQVKSGLRPIQQLRREACDGFARYYFPSSVILELHVWRPRARQPIVEVLNVEEMDQSRRAFTNTLRRRVGLS
jgi:hypothetical protein